MPDRAQRIRLFSQRGCGFNELSRLTLKLWTEEILHNPIYRVPRNYDTLMLLKMQEFLHLPHQDLLHLPYQSQPHFHKSHITDEISYLASSITPLQVIFLKATTPPTGSWLSLSNSNRTAEFLKTRSPQNWRPLSTSSRSSA